jgi:hypothetical protein
MSNQLTPDEYYNLVKNIYQLILDEIEDIQTLVKVKFLHTTYPKLVTMYEFFRLLRGEAFLDIRPHVSEHQNEFYQMEDNLQKKIKELSAKLDHNNPATKFHLDEAKKSFDIVV